MQITRKQLLQSAGALAFASAFGGTARAQDYPSQDIRLICAFPPGAAPTCWCATSARSCARS